MESFLAIPGQSIQLQPIKEDEIVYYHLEQVKKTNVDMPNLKLVSRGTEETANSGSRPNNPGPDPKLMIAVQHPAADNQVQTILQPAFPPEIKIKTNVSLPDVVPTSLIAARPSLALPPRVLRIRQASAPLPLRPPPQVLINADEAPKLALPRVADAVAVLAKPEIQPEYTDPQQGGDVSGLLILNRTAGQLSDVLAVPAGNRYGQFSVSPSGSNGPGSNDPGGGGGTGSHDGASSEGNGGRGTGGKGNGSGGGAANVSIVVSGSLNGGRPGIRGVRPDSLHGRDEESSIFPILKPPHIRKAPFLVAAGPGGGGGLNVYGALKGGKIYTVFLKMPGKDWILEYSTPDNLVQHTNQVTFGNAVAPPDATEEFDFQRLPVPPENRNKLIILKARIGADGLVANLSLYRGVQPQVDALALEAFAKWRFIPATRDGQPLPVDVLVGIPVIR